MLECRIEVRGYITSLHNIKRNSCPLSVCLYVGMPLKLHDAILMQFFLYIECLKKKVNINNRCMHNIVVTHISVCIRNLYNYKIVEVSNAMYKLRHLCAYLHCKCWLNPKDQNYVLQYYTPRSKRNP